MQRLLSILGLSLTLLAGPAFAGTLFDCFATTAAPTYVTGMQVPCSIDLAGNIRMGLGAGSAIIGNVRIDQTTPGTTNGVVVNSGTVSLSAPTTGGSTPYHLAGGTAASTNSTSVKGSAGTLTHLVAMNTTATLAYLKIYDSSSAPTCSSATNIKHVYPIPASATGAGFVIPVGPYGEAYANGIGYCVTGGGGDTDNTATVVGIYIEGSYK